MPIRRKHDPETTEDSASKQQRYPAWHRRRERRVLYASLLVFMPFLIASVWPLVRYSGAESWPSVSATINYLKVRGRAPRFAPSRVRANPVRLEPLGLQYTYSVAGKEYHSRCHTTFGAAPPAKELAEAYELGQEIVVHYNPANPGVAFIQLGTPGFDKRLLLFGLVATAMAALLVNFISTPAD